jgi:PAS domain S-box-containing protein
MPGTTMHHELESEGVAKSGSWGIQGIAGGLQSTSRTAEEVIAVVDSIDVPIVVVSRDFTVASFNRAAADALRLSVGDIGRSCRDTPAFNGLLGLEQRCSQVIASRRSVQIDLHDDEQQFAVRLTPYATGGGEIGGTILTFTHTRISASIDPAVYQGEFARSLLNSVEVPLLVVGSDLRVESGNRAFCAMFGVPHEATQGVSLDEIGHGAFDGASVRAELEKMLQGERDFRPVEVNHHPPGESLRTLTLDAHRLSVPGHSDSAVLVTFQDITADKTAARAQRESEEWRSIVDSMPGLVALLAVTGQVEVVNRQLSEYFGQTLEELNQWGTNGTVHPEDVAHVVDVFGGSIASGVPYHIVQRLRGADGTYRWFDNVGAPVRDAAGSIVRWCVLLTDIDERKRAEDAQRESERESRMIVDSIPGMVAVFSGGGTLQFVNRQTLEFYGIPLEEHRRWETGSHVHPQDLPRAAEGFARAVAEGKPFEIEVRARRSDGVYRWVQSRGYPLRDVDGQVVRWYNLMIDIDQRKRAEEDLAASERNLQLIIDTIPALAWSANPDGTAEFLNQHYLDYLGLTPERARGWQWTSAVHPEDLSGLADTWRRILESGAPGEAEARLRREDGEYRWFLFRANPLRDESGAILKWYGVNTDIEARKQTENALRRSETFLLEVQRLSHTGGWRYDTITNTVESSAEIRRGYDVLPSEDPSKPPFWFDRVHPDDRARVEEAFARSVSERNQYRAAYRIVLPSGAVRYQHVTAHPVFDDAGELKEFVGAAMDMTEHWQATLELERASEALRELQREMARAAQVAAVAQLAASIAHEVNQPLSGIITNAGTCLRMLDSDPPNVAGAQETARRALRDGNRAADIVARVRALYAKAEFTPEPVDLNEATREILTLSKSDLERNRVQVEEELADRLPLVAGDRVQLQQVILNLLRNAADAMTEVRERPRQLLVRTERESPARVRVTVRDTGNGIDAQSVDRVFEPFYTTKHDGMGIGLSICRSIIERHEGRLWAEPNDGPGATFAFVIPCREE